MSRIKSKKKNSSATKISNISQEASQAKINILNQQLYAIRNYQIEIEQKVLRLEEQNALLNAEKKSLNNSIKEYENLYKKWNNEKNNLITREQYAQQKLENIKQTKSFRLGYAMVFGFKSWGGFKHLIHTLKEIYHEKRTKTNHKNKVIGKQDITLQQPSTQQQINYSDLKPIIQWKKSIEESYLHEWHIFPIISTQSFDEIIPLNTERKPISIECHNISQLIIALNVFNKDKNLTAKQALLTINFYDTHGNILTPIVNIPFSIKLNCYYFYLNSDENRMDYITLILPPNTQYTELSIEPWDTKGELYLQNHIKVTKLTDGVSIIVPTYKGERSILKCLESLAIQSLSYSLFEILVIINGEQDNTKHLVKKFHLKHPQINIQVFELEEGNVSKARNFAISKANRTFVTFIDDDDWVANDYLTSLYLNSMYNRITITGIEDIQNGEIIRSNIMNQLDIANHRERLEYHDVTSALTMNACKLAPTYMIKNTHYNPTLKSGEDVLYWSELLNSFHPKVFLVHNYEQANYKRVIRDNSVSRKAESYEFNVQQRLEVIQGLEIQMSKVTHPKLGVFIQSKIDAQAGFVKRYLNKFPADYHRFITDIKNLNLHNCFINDINHHFSNTLVISYCYAPYIDTSGVVMSKRINTMNKPVDLISNNMNKVRKTDTELLQISNLYLGKHIELNASQAFANWQAIKQFSNLTLDAVHHLVKSRKVYDELYSRAMWPASHIAAAVTKMKYPQMKWKAEFSDPILVDTLGKQRFAEIETDWLHQQGFINQITDDTNKNLFYWCEQLPYLYADELIFTNTNQLDYMLSYAEPQQVDLIYKKSKIIPQPTLDQSFYKLSSAKLERDAESIYLGYFGSFYINRGFKPFFDAWSELPIDIRYKLKLYIYTQQDSESILETVPHDLKAQIILQEYVNYFDFLALSNQFDGLIVMDTQTKGFKINNPYLPSKISDYLGSHSMTLALIEEGSPVSYMQSNKLIKVDMHNTQAIQSALLQFISVQSRIGA